MKKSKFVLALIVLSVNFFGINSSVASSTISKTQAIRAIAGIKAELRLANANLATIKANQDSELNSALVSAANAQQAIQSKYESDKQKAQNELNSANSDLLKYSIFKVVIGNLSACGDTFQAHCDLGSIVTIPPTTPTSLVNVAFLLKIGALIPLDQANYQKSLDSISSIQQKILMLDSYLPSDKNANEASYKSASDKIYISYRPQIETAEYRVRIAQASLLAANRASKNSSNFLTAFQASLIFDFNHESIKVVASSTFDTINSLLSLYVVRDAIKYVGIGDAIESNYSTAKANSYNKYYGTTFYDDSFKTFLADATSLYISQAK